MTTILIELGATMTGAALLRWFLDKMDVDVQLLAAVILSFFFAIFPFFFFIFLIFFYFIDLQIATATKFKIVLFSNSSVGKDQF